MGPAAQAPPLDAGASAVTWVGGAALEGAAGPGWESGSGLHALCLYLFFLSTLFLLVLEREWKGEGERPKSAASAGPCWEWNWKPEHVP